MSTDHTTPRTLGAVIKDARDERGLSQKALEDLSGVGQRTISGIETGEVRNPGWEIVARLARALGLSVDELYGEVEAAS